MIALKPSLYIAPLFASLSLACSQSEPTTPPISSFGNSFDSRAEVNRLIEEIREIDARIRNQETAEAETLNQDRTSSDNGLDTHQVQSILFIEPNNFEIVSLPAGYECLSDSADWEINTISDQLSAEPASSGCQLGYLLQTEAVQPGQNLGELIYQGVATYNSKRVFLDASIQLLASPSLPLLPIVDAENTADIDPEIQQVELSVQELRQDAIENRSLELGSIVAFSDLDNHEKSSYIVLSEDFRESSELNWSYNLP